MARNPSLVSDARRRLAVLERVNPAGRVYHERWKELMEGPLPLLLRVMTEDSLAAEALRKESPFTALVPPEERAKIFADGR